MLRAAVIGLGVGERHIFGYEADPRCKVVALCDIDPDKLGEVAGRHPGRRTTVVPEDILDDPSIDVVSIASPDDCHHAQVMRAVAAGKHIFVEKPLCLTDDEFADIDAALAANPTLLMSSNLILRRSPRFRRLYEDFRHGRMGRLYYAEADYNYGRIQKILSGWRGRIPFYSVMHGGGIHMIDLLLWLSGRSVVEVTAYGTRIGTEDSNFCYPNTMAALLRFDDGMIAKVTSNYACVHPHYHNLSLYGTESSFVQTAAGAHYYRSRDPSEPAEAVSDDYPGAAKGDMIPAFVRAILDGSQPEVTAQEVLDCMRVSLAIEQSVRVGKPVQLRSPYLTEG